MPANRPMPLSVSEWLAQPATAQRAVPVRRLMDTEARASAPGVLEEVVMSTRSEDRARDTIAPAGFRLANFVANPVLLWAHDYSLPPVGRVGSVSVSGEALIGRQVQFTPREVSEFGFMIGQMYTHSPAFLRAFSIGMLPVEWKYDEERGGVDFLEQELLELSACPVPMNPECLAGAKSAGIDVGLFLPFAEKSLDGAKDAPHWLPPAEAIAVYRSLVPRAHPVPAASPLANHEELVRQMKELAAQVQQATTEIARVRQEMTALIVSPSAAVAPTKAPPFNSERVVARLTARLDERLAEITGRITPE